MIEGYEAQFARLSLLSNKGEQIWLDTMTLPEPFRTQTFAMWRDEPWTQDADVLSEVLRIVQVIGVGAATVSGIAGAGTAVAALRAI